VIDMEKKIKQTLKKAKAIHELGEFPIEGVVIK